MNSQLKRYSAINICSPWRAVVPIPTTMSSLYRIINSYCYLNISESVVPTPLFTWILNNRNHIFNLINRNIKFNLETRNTTYG